jgi:hypothetical protein
MNNRQRASERTRLKRATIAVDGGLALVSLLLIVQMWLLTASLESHLAGHIETALPAAILSGILFGCSAGLYYFVRRVEKQTGPDSSKQ